MLTGKNIVLAVTGGIAAYKMADVASMLVKQHAEVHVVMTKNACRFIAPETFQVLTKHKVYTDCFDEDVETDVKVPHVTLGTEADCILVAPATADVIGKIANGIADDMVTTVVLPARCPILISPSMNVYMYENAIVQDNLRKLARFGFQIIEPATGHLACGYDGKGKLPAPEELVDAVILAAAGEKDLRGKKILVNAGPTREPLDPVRFITNHSSGKMGYAIASAAAVRGADVTLVSGPVSLPAPAGVKRIRVETAEEMYTKMMDESVDSDIMILAAAVADFTPAEPRPEKIKKGEGGLSLSMKRTRDILKALGESRKKGQILVGFSMETQNVLENSRKKLTEKNADLICANDLREEGAGYAVDTNILTLIDREREIRLPKMTKYEAANRILDHILTYFPVG